MKQYRYRQVQLAAIVTGITVVQDPPDSGPIVSAAVQFDDGTSYTVQPQFIEQVAVAPGFFGLFDEEGALHDIMTPEQFNGIFEDLPPTPEELEEAGQQTLLSQCPECDVFEGSAHAQGCSQGGLVEMKLADPATTDADRREAFVNSPAEPIKAADIVSGEIAVEQTIVYEVAGVDGVNVIEEADGGPIEPHSNS